MNFGEMEFDTYDSGEAGGSLYNNCMLFVEHMKAGGIVYLDHGVIAEEKEDDEENELFEEADDIEFYDNAKVTLANGSMIKAKNIIAKSGLSVNGEGNETSLLKATEKVQIQNWDIRFNGRLCITGKISCSNPDMYQAGSEVTFSESPDVIITGCNGKAEVPDPAPEPSDPVFPIIVDDNHNYTYLFEDHLLCMEITI